MQVFFQVDPFFEKFGNQVIFNNIAIVVVCFKLAGCRNAQQVANQTRIKKVHLW